MRSSQLWTLVKRSSRALQTSACSCRCSACQLGGPARWSGRVHRRRYLGAGISVVLRPAQILPLIGADQCEAAISSKPADHRTDIGALDGRPSASHWSPRIQNNGSATSRMRATEGVLCCVLARYGASMHPSHALWRACVCVCVRMRVRVRSSASHRTASHRIFHITLQYITSVHQITVQYITLHYIALHCIAYIMSMVSLSAIDLPQNELCFSR